MRKNELTHREIMIHICEIKNKKEFTKDILSKINKFSIDQVLQLIRNTS